MRLKRALLWMLMLSMLAACASRGGPQPSPAERSYETLDGPPSMPFDVDSIPEPVPRAEPLSRYGNHTPYVVMGKRYYVLPRHSDYRERGIASWYGTKFHGRLTSTREPYDMYRFTAAHKTLPLPSYARVTNLDNGKSVVVRINDRGPFVDNRIIDLSYAAAVKIGMHMKGTARVEVHVLETPDHPQAAAIAPRTEAPPRPAQPTPATAAASAGLYLQVAAFSARENAFAYRRRLLAAGFTKVKVYSALGVASSVYRVRLGPLRNEAEGEHLNARLRELGFASGQLLRR